MSTPENSSPDPLARGLSKDELAAIEAARGKQVTPAQTPPPAPAEPRKVYLDHVGLMAWRGLVALHADAQARLDQAEKREAEARDGRLLSLLTHLGALDLLRDGYAVRAVEGEAGKVYLESVPLPGGES